MPDADEVKVALVVPGEAAIIAIANAIEAVAKMVTALTEGQPPEVRENAWKRWDRDIGIVRKFFKIED